MIKNIRVSPFFLLSTVTYLTALYFFYFKYVPIVKPFQAILAPILFVVFILTTINVQWGTLFFIFFFPLISILPYFFGIFENTPHAPTALVLFLFYFLGWLLHNTLYKQEFALSYKIFKPIFIFSLFVIISSVITFFRYANFYPFLSDYIYELTTNVKGVTAGGAIMSIVLTSLNYLSGFGFFFILLNAVKSKEFLKKILIVLLVSTLISITFGFYQHFEDLKFGSNIRSFNQGLVNGTFKDALSFGGFLAIIIPVILSLILAFKGFVRIFSILIIIPAFFIFPHTGSKSGFIAMIISLLLFIFILIKIKWREINFPSGKEILSLLVIFIFIVVTVIALIVSFQNSRTSQRLEVLVNRYNKGRIERILGRRLTYHWKLAAYMIEDYPLTGVGIGAFIIESSNYSELNKVRYRESQSTENYFLQVVSELGILTLFFSFWIFWEIFKQIKRSLSKYLFHDRWKYIQIGISCGIISLFMIFFVHTYIGSYEVKYTFWLLVGLIFCLGRRETELKKKSLFSKNFKIFCISLIVLYSVVHTWNSIHSQSLKSRTEELGLDQNFGLYQKEKTHDGMQFQWTRGYGGMTIKIEKPVIEIPLLASHPDIRKNPVKVKIYLIKDFFKQKELLGEIILSKSIWKTYEYYIPEEVDQEVILLVKVSRTWNPLRAFGTSDPRNLGVAVGKIGFKDMLGIPKIKNEDFVQFSPPSNLILNHLKVSFKPRCNGTFTLYASNFAALDMSE